MPQEQTQSWFDLNKPVRVAADIPEQPNDSWFDSQRPRGGSADSGVPASDHVLEFLRPLMAAGLIGGGTAAAGPIGTALGSGAAIATDLTNQYTQSKPPASLTDALSGTGKMLATNEAGGALFRGLGSLISKIPTLHKYRTAGEDAVRGLTGNKYPADDAINPEFLSERIQAQLGSMANYYKSSIFSKNGLRQLISNEDSPIPIVNQILSDPVKLGRTLNVGKIVIPGGGVLASENIRQDLAGYQLTQLMRMGPQRALEALADPNKQDVYSQLYSSATRSNLQQLFRAGQTATRISGTFERAAFWSGGIAVSASLFTGHISAYHAAGAAVSGMYLTGSAINQIFKNRPLSRALINLTEGLPAGLSDQAISRMLSGALAGTGAAVGLIDNKGNIMRGTVERDDDGTAKFTPLARGGAEVSPAGFRKQSPEQEPSVQTQIVP